MEKISTIFERDAKTHGVVDVWKPECIWVRDGMGDAVEKVDGTNVRVTVRAGYLVRLEKRRNPSLLQKHKGIKDPWYVDADENDPGDKYIWEAALAFMSTSLRLLPGEMPDGEHPCEAFGKNIQGNPLMVDVNTLFPFSLALFRARATYQAAFPRTFAGLWKWMRSGSDMNSINPGHVAEGLMSRISPGCAAEGLVFYHPDGRMAKIKRKDFR